MTRTSFLFRFRSNGEFKYEPIENDIHQKHFIQKATQQRNLINYAGEF